MICQNCGAQLEEKMRFCTMCGAQVTAPATDGTSFCKYCGEKLEARFAFCPICGQPKGAVQPIAGSNVGSFRTINPKTGKKIATISGIVVGIAAIVLVIVLLAGGGLKSKLIGQWSTEQGLDSTIYSFKESGDLRIVNFDGGTTYSYRLEGNTLIIVDNGYYNSETKYEYSELAKNRKEGYWYIDGDTLYLGSKKLYKQTTKEQ